MARNKSVYEIMGNVSDIVKEGDYEVHAERNPSGNFVQAKSASAYLAESSDYRKAKVMEALAKTSIGAMQTIGQMKAFEERKEAKAQAEEDRRTRKQKALDAERERQEIDMQTLNIETLAGKAQNEWTAFQTNGTIQRTAEDGSVTDVLYKDMTVAERDAERLRVYSPVHAYSETANTKVRNTWGKLFNRLEVTERDKNIPKDFQRFLTTKTDGIFEVLDQRQLTEEYTQENWNNTANSLILSVARNTGVEVKELNTWATNSAINGLNNMDPRWYEYAKSQKLFNTADFKNSNQFSSLQNALKGYEKNVKAMLSEQKIQTVVNLNNTATTANRTDQNLVAPVLTKEEQTKARAATLKGWLEESQQLLGGAVALNATNEDVTAYVDNIYDTIQKSIVTGIDIPQHKQAIQNTLASILKGEVNDKRTMLQGLTLYQQYNRATGGVTDIVTDKQLAIMGAFDEFQQVEGLEAAAARIAKNAANPIPLNARNRFEFGADFLIEGSDDFFLTRSYNAEAEKWAVRYGNDLVQFGGLTRDQARAKTTEAMNSRYAVIRSEGFFSDFTTRVNMKPISDALANPSILANNPHITDTQMYMGKLTGEYIPAMLDEFRSTLNEENMSELTLTTTTGDNNSPIYSVSDSTGAPMIFNRVQKDSEGNVVYTKNEFGNKVPAIAEYGVNITLTPQDLIDYGKKHEINKAEEAVNNEPINVELKQIENEFAAYKAGNRLLGRDGSYQKLDNPDDPIYVSHRQQLQIEKERLLGFKELGLSLAEGEELEDKQNTLNTFIEMVERQPQNPSNIHYNQMIQSLTEQINKIKGIK
mgnify:CR=1 FL=1